MSTANHLTTVTILLPEKAISGRRDPAIIGDHCEVGPDTYIGPYTSTGDHIVIRNTEIENSIMEGCLIDCGKRIVDSLIGRRATILSSDLNLPKGHKLFLGDQSTVTL